MEGATVTEWMCSLSLVVPPCSCSSVAILRSDTLTSQVTSIRMDESKVAFSAGKAIRVHSQQVEAVAFV